jgi:hypothetical protein
LNGVTFIGIGTGKRMHNVLRAPILGIAYSLRLVTTTLRHGTTKPELRLILSLSFRAL